MPACDQILPHGSYLVNLGSQDAEMLQKSYTAFVGELRRCEVRCAARQLSLLVHAASAACLHHGARLCQCSRLSSRASCPPTWLPKRSLLELRPFA